MFGKFMRRGVEVDVEVDALHGLPLSFAWKGLSRRDVTAVHGRWREWSVDGADIECWRVESATGLVVVLAFDLDSGAWSLVDVWD